MRHDIAFLHTASVHVVTFNSLMAELAPGLAVRHDVDERPAVTVNQVGV